MTNRLAVGGAGGRRIPNGLLEILAQFVAQKRTFHDSMTAPRLHTEGSGALSFEKDMARSRPRPASSGRILRQHSRKRSDEAPSLSKEMSSTNRDDKIAWSPLSHLFRVTLSVFFSRQIRGLLVALHVPIFSPRAQS